MTTVAFSMRGPETGTTVAPRMAKYCGSPPCAASLGAPVKTTNAAVKANEDFRAKTKCIHDSFFGWRGRRDPRGIVLAERTRLVGSRRSVKAVRVDFEISLPWRA